MRVRFRNPSRDSYSDNVARFYSPRQTHLSTTLDYEVHAVSVYDGIVFLLIFDDHRFDKFAPHVLFDVVDPSIPSDWICNTFPTDPVQLVMGPPFLAKDLRSYRGLIGRDGGQFDVLLQRLYAQEEAEATRCPVCGLDQSVPPYGERGDDPTYYTCDCCGVEYNFEPMTPERARELRQRWLDSGAKWLRPEIMPLTWDKDAQLREVPRQFR